MTRSLLERHAGVWVGRYRHVTPALEVIDAHDFRIRVELPNDDSCGYRQSSVYTWPDGRTQDLLFEADFEQGGERLSWDNGRIAGAMHAIDEETLYLNFVFADAPDQKVCEMIQLSACGRHRARTWHWLRAGELERLTLVNEVREE